MYIKKKKKIDDYTVFVIFKCNVINLKSNSLYIKTYIGNKKIHYNILYCTSYRAIWTKYIYAIL